MFSDSIEDHEKHLKLVFNKLREAKLYLSRTKCDLYSERMDCLGHIVDERGLHADADKMARIRDWRTPRSYLEVQRFIGLVNYLAPFMPDVSAYTSPLTEMSRNERAFVWRPLHQVCLERIKAMACRAPILKPIDPKKDKPIWLICDASIHGVGALYGQGKDWQTCHPAGFLSRKFSSAQRSYPTYEQEALAILEGLMKWEDKLMGRKFTVVTDHKSLEFFKKSSNPSPRRVRWLDYMSRFDYMVRHVPGKDNKVADCLSRYFENDNVDEFHPPHEYVNTDVRLDPDWDHLPQSRVEELRAGRVTRQNPKGLEPQERDRQRGLKMVVEPRTVEAEEMAQAAAREPAPSSPLVERAPPAEASPSPEGENLTVGQSMATGPPLQARVEKIDGFMKSVQTQYAKDPTFRKVLENPAAHKAFTLREGLLFTTNRQQEPVLCLPIGTVGKRTITQIAIDLAHTTVGHFSALKTSEYARRWFWWPKMGRDIEKYCMSCQKCQASKPRNHLIAGLLHKLPTPLLPWISIAMDFVGPFPRSNGYDYLWVVVCRLTSMVHLIPIRTTDTAADLAAIFLKEVVRLHGLPQSIVSDRDPKFTSAFWRELHRMMGARLLMSTAFHPQTDGTSERTIRSINQVLRSMVNPDQLDWIEKIPITEFALNSSVSATTGFAPFELNYGYLPRTMAGIRTDTQYEGVRAFAERARNNLMIAHDAILNARVNQTHYANQHRQEEPDIREGSLVFLSTQNLSFPKGRARKLIPKFIGPYKVQTAHPETSTYTLELPEDLRKRKLNPTFHVSLLRRHEPNDDVLFPHRDSRAYYDVGAPEEQEWYVEEIIGHRWVGNKLELRVRWTHDDESWEAYSECSKLSALDEYLALRGVKSWRSLPKDPQNTGT